MFEQAMQLGIIDLLLLGAIVLTSAYMAFKFRGEHDGISAVFAAISLGILAILFLSPFIIPQTALTQLASFGLWAIPLLWILAALTPPYPDAELIIILPLRALLGVPLWLGEVISIVLALVLFFLFLPNIPELDVFLAQAFKQTSLFTWGLSAAWFIMFLVVNKFTSSD